MVQIEFDYKEEKTIIEANKSDKFQDIINKFIQKFSLDPTSLYFIVNDKKINPELTIESLMNQLNRVKNNLKVYVKLIKDNNTENENIIKSKNIICPVCNELCRIKIDNYRIKLYGCNNKHVINDIKLKDFQNLQKINLSDIICGTCKINNKGNYSNLFYKCLKCNYNLCSSCMNNHELKHEKIDYEVKDFICQKHIRYFSKFCQTCNINMCASCDEEHKGHETKFVGYLDGDISEEKKTIAEIQNNIFTCNTKIKLILEKFNKLIECMLVYAEINDTILKSYINERPNYLIYQNLNEINLNNEIFQSIKDINATINEKDILSKLIDFYNNINFDNTETTFNKLELKNNQKENKGKNISDNRMNKIINNINQMTLIYNVKHNMDKIRLFGEKFVKNNKNNCYLLIDGKQTELLEYYQLNYKITKHTLLIKLIEKKPITNMSYMFLNCSSLKSLPDISKFNFKNVNYAYGMFYNCISLIPSPDISKWETNKNLDKNQMILESFLDISKWETKVVTNIDSKFFSCNSIITLLNISEWDIKYINEINTTYMNNKDDDSSSESSQNDDEDKVNTNRVVDMSYMFRGCNSLKNVGLDNWKIKKKNVDTTGMFDGCTSLKNIPAIYKMKGKKKAKKEFMFSGGEENIIKRLKDCNFD